MDLNQFNAAFQAAAAPGSSVTNHLTTAISNILANSNIDLSQLGLNLGGHAPALNAAALLQPQQRSQPSSRQSLQQAHHHRSTSSGLNNSQSANINSNPHIPSSMSNLQSADVRAAVSAAAGLPASLGNLNSSALADLAAGIFAQHQQPAHSARSSLSIQSAHHRSSSNHHQPTSQLTAAHQSTSASKNLLAHQSQNTIHHRNSSSHNSSYNNHYQNNSINHNIITNHNASSNNISSINQPTIIATNNTSSITPPKSSTCYRIGDCVYFESSPTLPLQIGRIDEICKTTGDNIEVKVVVFFRRRDISSSLMTLADKYQYDESQEEEIKLMSEKEKNLLKQRELFYSRQIETIAAASIKGKCTVQLLNESESLASYINKEDQYFYTLVYDPQQKTISADRGEIRVGQRYQAEVQPAPIHTPQAGGDPADTRDLSEMENLVYTPDHNLTDDEINKFLTIAKSVGTFARALDCSSSIKQPSLHLTAASASRDVTLLYAMQLLHQNNYDLGKACCALVPSTGPVLCRDEIEEWTAGEATLFEEAIEKYGREFRDIRQDFLPWKSVKNIVEYYYMWKTTDRSISQRRMKALEAENKVSVIYIVDPESEKKPSISNSNSVSDTGINSNDNANNNSDFTSDANTNNGTNTSSVAPASTNLEQQNPDNSDQGKPKSLKRSAESDDTALNSSSSEFPNNATLKRRQVTEPKLSAHVACHTTPGENLRFIANKRHKSQRRMLFTRKQMKRMSRRPWERKAGLRR